MQTRDEALLCQLVWKSDEMKAFAVAVVKRGLELLDKGTTHFGADDVAEAPEGPGTAGNVMSLLCRTHVIKHFRGNAPEEKCYGGQRPTKRPGSKGALIATYEIISRAAVETFLSRNKVDVVPKQTELSFSENKPCAPAAGVAISAK